MNIPQFLRRTPAIAGSGTVAIGARDVPYVDLRPETAPALDELLERLPPASRHKHPGLRLIALVSPQGSDVLAQAAVRKGVAVIEASPRESTAGVLARFGSTWEQLDAMRTSGDAPPAAALTRGAPSQASKLFSQPPPWMNAAALKKRLADLQKPGSTEDGASNDY